MIKNNFKIGDIVKTDFNRRKNDERKVVAVRYGEICESGVMIDTVSESGEFLDLDSNWYEYYHKPLIEISDLSDFLD